MTKKNITLAGMQFHIPLKKIYTKTKLQYTGICVKGICQYTLSDICKLVLQ